MAWLIMGHASIHAEGLERVFAVPYPQYLLGYGVLRDGKEALVGYPGKRDLLARSLHDAKRLLVGSGQAAITSRHGVMVMSNHTEGL